MAICVITGNGHRLQGLQQNWIAENLGNSDNLIFVVVADQGPQDVKFDNVQLLEVTTLSSESTVEAIFDLKSALDENKCLEAKILVPEKNLDECTNFVKLLFPEACKVTVEVFPAPEKVRPWVNMLPKDGDHASSLRKFLTTVPSSDDVKTVKSSMIPSNLFVHGCTMRYGGITQWPTMGSLNLVYSVRKPDSIFVIRENARRLCSSLGHDPEKYHLAKANHGNKIWVYEKPSPASYDGIVTRTPGVLVASPAADCNMLILADPVTKSCGAIHAGWKGILVGIVEAALDAMVREYQCDPRNILAYLGPSLSVCCCEFGIEDSKKFLSIRDDVVVWKKGKEKPHIDLRLATTILLQKSGIKPENIDDGVHGSNPTSSLAVCTKCDPKKDFFSFRRDGPKFGNQVAFISLK